MSSGFDVEIETDGHTIRVKGDIAATTPATMSEPEEGGELEDVVMYLVHYRKDKKPMTRLLKDKDGVLFERLYESINDAIANQNWEPDYDTINDERRERAADLKADRDNGGNQ